jgi:hypothetical protein
MNAMKCIQYGCECGLYFSGFKFPVVQLVIHIAIIFLVDILIYDGWGWALIDYLVLSMRASKAVVD